MSKKLGKNKPSNTHLTTLFRFRVPFFYSEGGKMRVSFFFAFRELFLRRLCHMPGRAARKQNVATVGCNGRRPVAGRCRFFFVCVSFSSFSLSLSSHFGFNRIFSLPTARNRVDSVLWTATAVTRALLGCYRVFFLFDSGCLFTECHWLRQLWISTVGYRVVIDFLVLPGYSGFYQVLPGITKFHRVLLGFT